MYILLFLFLLSPLSAWEFVDRAQEIITLEESTEDELLRCEEIFIDAFTLAYKDFTLEMLGIDNLYHFLQAAFSDVYSDYQKGTSKIICAKHEGRVIGFAGFSRTETPHEIYISQLAVDPHYWRRGIGKHLVFASLTLYEDAKSLVVIPRRINDIAKKFYYRLGFFECPYMHPGYDAKKYVGYEWKRAP